MASIIMTMIDQNRPLCKYREFLDMGGTQQPFAQQKSPEKYAQAIFSQLSHPEAVALVAREFGGLSQQVRIQLRTLCSVGNGSGNVRKGVQRLNELLRGELLREEQELFVSRRVETPFGVSYQKRQVNPAVAGAQRKYADAKYLKKK